MVYANHASQVLCQSKYKNQLIMCHKLLRSKQLSILIAPFPSPTPLPPPLFPLFSLSRAPLLHCCRQRLSYWWPTVSVLNCDYQASPSSLLLPYTPRERLGQFLAIWALKSIFFCRCLQMKRLSNLKLVPYCSRISSSDLVLPFCCWSPCEDCVLCLAGRAVLLVGEGEQGWRVGSLLMRVGLGECRLREARFVEFVCMCLVLLIKCNKCLLGRQGLIIRDHECRS